MWYLFLLGWGSEGNTFLSSLSPLLPKTTIGSSVPVMKKTLDERINVPENSCFCVLCGELLYQNTFEGFYSQKRKKKNKT